MVVSFSSWKEEAVTRAYGSSTRGSHRNPPNSSRRVPSIPFDRDSFEQHLFLFPQRQRNCLCPRSIRPLRAEKGESFARLHPRRRIDPSWGIFALIYRDRKKKRVPRAGGVKREKRRKEEKAGRGRSWLDVGSFNGRFTYYRH